MTDQNPPSSGRLASLDIFRGLTIAAMIIVNTPGSDAVYSQLDHSAWNGCTFTDLLFPFFIFITGAAIPYSLSKHLNDEGHARTIRKIFTRTLIIFALGIALNALSNHNPATIRIPGVLQRIAVCYCLASLLFLKTGIRAQVLTAVSILAAYWLIMTQIPVPGFGAGVLTKEGSVSSFIDRAVFGVHAYRQGPYDPEGLLGTLPALVTAMSGVFAGAWMRSSRTAREKITGLASSGMVCLGMGLAWSFWFPLNKALWTSSYVLFTSGMALFVLMLIYWAVDMRGWKRLNAAEAFGKNAIAAYILPIVVLKLVLIKNLLSAESTTAETITAAVFGRWMPAEAASAAFAVCYMLLWLAFFKLLHKKNIFIKI